ncbi:hypothetical protein KAU55_05955, partial [Candidatus Bathyarchaeota archaeon]|nr:hypothetical protein [Candidatus Bathyarchaeota archaeon]
IHHWDITVFVVIYSTFLGHHTVFDTKVLSILYDLESRSFIRKHIILCFLFSVIMSMLYIVSLLVN